jgi:hypothetical protein
VDKRYFFERNLLALSRRDPGLCARLSAAETTRYRYKFLESRSGDIIPAALDSSGAAHPLHSMVDPPREGRRLVESLHDEGFIIFLGLGGGYHVEAALEKDHIHRVLVIEYDIDGLAELLSAREYIRLLQDPRLFLLVDLPAEDLEKVLLELYQPALFGGIRVLPLRTRTALRGDVFGPAVDALEQAIGKVSPDYSVQAYFGTRWFSNIVRNIPRAEEPAAPLPPIGRAAVTAAGPSLGGQLSRLRERRKSFFLIAVDTSLPCLLSEDIVPDAVISIDCQHYSYYHFMQGLPSGALLFLDLASPPLVASRSAKPRFLSGGHPLTRYISMSWRSFPELDTSGANVTFAAVSLAEKLGAPALELYGADYAYPLGQSYVRGTYIHPYFEVRQNRLSPLESLFSSFLYRSPLVKKSGARDTWYYETGSLKFYREKLEEKSRTMAMEILPIPGLGAPLELKPSPRGESGGFPGHARPIRLFSSGKPRTGGREFLARYAEDIRRLPFPKREASLGLQDLSPDEGRILTTLLPAAAAIKRKNPSLDTGELMDAVKDWCVGEIERGIGIEWGSLPMSTT